uniref:Uncharacterized protein n=1 Tax=Opuntia streptacantha TaxID=393608 RepID=A0A7C9AD65_OPUST
MLQILQVIPTRQMLNYITTGERASELINLRIAENAPNPLMRITRRKNKARVFERGFDIGELLAEAGEERGERISVAREEIVAATLIMIDSADLAEFEFRTLLHVHGGVLRLLCRCCFLSPHLADRRVYVYVLSSLLLFFSFFF